NAQAAFSQAFETTALISTVIILGIAALVLVVLRDVAHAAAATDEQYPLTSGPVPIVVLDDGD
ncbi:MAG: hypothetical protein AB7P33_08150, partial [Dehalococcoidia bacterium]